MLSLRLLGQPRVQYQGGCLQPKPGKPLYLLLYAAYRGEWLDRNKLGFFFWPDASEQKSQQNLRRLIHRAKELEFSTGLEVEKFKLRWRVKTDVQVFRAALAKQDWQTALELYKGSFLEGLHPKNSEAFTAWLEQERADLERVWRNAIHKQVEDLEREGQVKQAVMLLQQRLEHEPLAEDVLQKYLRNAYLLGERDAALATFSKFEKLLKQELELEPLDDTLELVKALKGTKALKSVALNKSEKTAELIPLTVLRPPQLVGRDDAIAIIQQASTPAVFIAGEAGIGKSRLMAELAPDALLISCQEGLQKVPYYPVLSLIRRLVDEGIQTPDLKHYTDDLARLIPEAAPNIRPGPADPETGRSRLFEALALYLEHVAALKGAAHIQLLLDDLQWADSSTLDLVVYLINKKTLKLLGAYRVHEQSKALKETIQGLNSSRLLTEVRLEPLSKATIQDFMASLMGVTEGPPLFSEWLARGTGGNPMYMLETLKSLFEAGTLQVSEQGWQTDIDEVTRDYSEIQIPTVIQDLIQRRVETLKPETQRVLQVASVISQGFSPQLISQISGLSEWAVIDGFDEAETNAIIDKASFTHDLFRQSVYSSLADPRRKLLHKKVAETLKDQADPARVAEHWFAIGENDKAALAWLEAAQTFYQKGLYEQAEGLLERVLSSSPEAKLQQEAAMWLANIYYRLNKVEEADKLIQSLLSEVKDARVRAYTLLTYAEEILERGHVEQAEGFVEEAKRLMQGQAEKALANRLLMAQMNIYYMQGHYKQASLVAEKALKQMNGMSDLSIAFLSSLAVMYNKQARHQDALACHQKAALHAKKLCPTEDYIMIVNNYLCCAIELGSPELALKQAEEALHLGEYYSTNYLRHSVAWAYQKLQRHEEVLKLAEHVYTDSSNQKLRIMCALQSVDAYYHLGEQKRIGKRIDEALDLVKTIEVPQVHGDVFLSVFQYGNKEQQLHIKERIASFDLSLLPAETQRKLERYLS